MSIKLEASKPIFISYIYGADVASSISKFGRPDVVNLAFGFPGHNASDIDVMTGFNESGTTFTKSKVEALQKQGSLVLASMGGGSYCCVLNQAMRSKKNHGWGPELIIALVKFVEEYHLDGIDLDIEFNAGEDPDMQGIESFITGLSDKLGVSSANKVNKK